MLLTEAEAWADFYLVAGASAAVLGFDRALFLLAAAVVALSLLAIANSWTLSLISTEPGGD